MTSPIDELLLDKIEQRRAQIGVIGLGYVGLPLAFEFSRSGYPVFGIDVDQEKVRLINEGTCYIDDIPHEEFRELVRKGALRASQDFSKINSLDVICICVPTPLRKTRDPDMSFIFAVVEELRKFVRKGQMIVLESTTYPGTTEEVLLPMLHSNGFQVGEDIALVFSPERTDPGNKKFHLRNTPKVIGGASPKCAEMAKALYSKIVDSVILVSNPKTAEMVKLLENTFRLINIALVNELSMICHKLGVNIWEVIEAASTKPFGYMPFYPGPGLGGHCIPIDPHYLSWKLKAHNFNARFIDLATDINISMPRYIVARLGQLMNARGKTFKGSRLLILGLSYKRDIDDVRESSSLEIIDILQELQADLLVHDPYVPSCFVKGRELRSVLLTDEVLSGIDGVLLLTDHTNLPYNLIHQCCPLILDTRNAFVKHVGHSEKVFVL